MKTRKEVKATYTPGPWELFATGNTKLASAKFTVGNGIQIADCNNRAPEYDNGEVEANARLIVAAPEMKTLLEDCREFVLRFDETDEDELAMSQRISALLDKIEGRD